VTRPANESEEPAAGDRPRARRSRLWGVLRTLLTLAILGFVLTTLPWRDTLTWRQGGEERLSVHGAIAGEWRGEAVRFRVADDVTAEPGWPPLLADAARTHEPVPVARAGPGEDGYDWRPGMPRVFRSLDPAGLLPAVGLLLLGLVLVSARWWRLLELAGCRTSYPNALRLTLLGLFFNLVLPGLTGGDVVKAVLVVRQNPNRRADALVTVVVDRVIGLVVLVGLAWIVVLVSGERFAALRVWWSALFAALLFGLWVLVHPGARRLLRFDAILARLPQRERLEKIDRALQLYGARPGALLAAVGLTAVNHLAIAGTVYVLGRAYGETALGYLDYLAIASVANTLSAVPLSPSGWGVGEAAFRELFLLVGAAATVGVAVSITFRLLMMLEGLAGGVLLLLPGWRDARAKLEGAPEPAGER
jgi:glycosyltransferase 2 family protein